MGLHKGQSNNVNGRPKGSKNNDTAEHRKFIKDFVEDFNKSGEFARVFKKLVERDKMKVYLDLMQYVAPKLQSVSNEVNFAGQLPPIIIQPAPEFEPIKENGVEQ